MYVYLGRNLLCSNGRMECGFSIDGGWILMEDDSLCGGRTLLGGLHARFVCMDIWAVIRFALNGRMGMWVFG
ncbi:hypothetical protein FH009_08745 [Listeria monocytogenes]|nr:hypothetical protein [Listeria monocytogenes]